MTPEERLIDIERTLWAKIKEHQAGGGLVRNTDMADRFGGRLGTHADSPATCLVGLYTVAEAGVWFKPIMQELGITSNEAEQLENGFENYAREEDPFYAIGRRIGQALEEQEVTAYVQGTHGQEVAG